MHEILLKLFNFMVIYSQSKRFSWRASLYLSYLGLLELKYENFNFI